VAKERATAEERAALKKTVDAALDVLKADPAKMKELLRNGAELASEIATVLAVAKEKEASGKVKAAATALKGAALLPGGMAVGLIRKTLEKFLG
jgi:hypothetical protein